MFDIEYNLDQAPTSPGVYLMKDKVGTIIYVGKAKNLRNRLRQYFQPGQTNRKVKAMVENIYEFEYIIVDTEVESLVLEQNLIKQYMPKYNILLKDDKQYPYIVINIKDKYPKVARTRLPKDDGSIYFGPFTETIAVNESIEFFSKHFKLRTCGLNLNKENPKNKVCLNYHIDQCSGPCEGLISQEDYNKRIEKVINFLEGKDKSLLKYVKEEMLEASKNLDFERATEYRNLHDMLLALLTKQNVERLSVIDKDIIGSSRLKDEIAIQIFFVRGGKVLGREHYILEDSLDLENKEILSTFIKQYYGGYTKLPNEIYIEEELADQDIIEDYLTKLKGKKVRLVVPHRGENLDLMRLVQKNARDMIIKHGKKFIKRNEKNHQTLEELKNLLNLKNFPKRIEAYDISHIAGDQSSGAMVVFENGQAKKSDYRKFRLQTSKNDDYQSLYEVLTRRFRRAKMENQKKNESFLFLPDLIMMDGGKGQVGVAHKVIKEMNISNIPVVGLVKDEFHQTRGLIYKGVEYLLPVDTDLYRLIYKIQEEAHRFAIDYHRSRMSNRIYQSELDNIKGVGPKRKRELLKHFKSVENIKSASLEDLQEVKSMSKPSAKSVYEYFRGD